MNNCDLDNFIVNITEADIKKEFDDPQWEENVANAAFLGAICLSNSKDISPDWIIKDIVNYNVLKKLRNLFLEKAKPLPAKFIWNKDIDTTTAFAILENYVAQVSLMKEAELLDKPIKLKINTTDTKIQERLVEWCNYFQKVNYQHLNITLKKMSKNIFVFTFDK